MLAVSNLPGTRKLGTVPSIDAASTALDSFPWILEDR